MSASARHKWGKPERFPLSTMRVCVRCCLVRLTRHEPNVRPWVEFWRECERTPGDRTPPCSGPPPAPAVDLSAVDREAVA